MKSLSNGFGRYEDMDRVEKMDCRAKGEVLLRVLTLLQPNSWERLCQPLPTDPHRKVRDERKDHAQRTDL